MSLSINIVNLGISQLQLHASDQEVHWTVKEEDYDNRELELFIKFVNYEADTTPAPNTPPPITWTLYPYTCAGEDVTEEEELRCALDTGENDNLLIHDA